MIRQVLDCGSPLPLFARSTGDGKAAEDCSNPRRSREGEAAL